MRNLEDEFGDIIQKARQGQEWDLKKLSENTGIPTARLKAYESYRTKPTENEVKLLAEHLNLDPDKLSRSAAESWYPDEVDPALEPESPLPGIEAEYSARLFSPSFRSNCYLFWDDDKNQVLIIDPGFDPGRIAETVAGWAGLQPDDLIHSTQPAVTGTVFLTHTHSDHCGALREITGWLEGQVILHREEGKLNTTGNLDCEYIEDDQKLNWSSRDVSILHIPGHTPGSLSFRIGRSVFTGDSLFAGSLGRTGDGRRGYRRMTASVKEKILSLPEETLIFPGHCGLSTVGDERRQNPFFSF